MRQYVKLTSTSFIVLSFILLLNSCNKMDELSGEDVPGYSPILVSTEPIPPFSRTYIPTGMYNNFKVHAVSEQGSTQKVVMDGYEVRFVTDNWSYITETQQLMYWDYTADRYRFLAGAPINAVTSVNATTLTLHLENNTTGSAMVCEPQKIERGSANFGKTVNLSFSYAHCRVCVAFVKNTSAETQVTDILLTPDSPITSEADITYTYDWSTAQPTATSLLSKQTTSQAGFDFTNVTIPANTTGRVLSSTTYYCVPDATNTNVWTVSLNDNGEPKSAQFVNEQNWESGKNYIYIFSLEKKTPKLLYVVSQDLQYFDCNDIVPGGDFSNTTDMTE